MISNKILIVDDEIEIIDLLETVLKHEIQTSSYLTSCSPI